MADGHVVKGALYCIAGDNLGSHTLGGFTENFSSSEYFCRYCLISRTAFEGADPNVCGQARTPETYRAAIDQLETEGVLQQHHRDSKKVVATHPKSLQYVIDGDIIGLGYHSLVKQLQVRVENVKRSDTPKIKKRKIRKEINAGASIQKLSQEWPFLFKEVGMVAHFQELTGVHLIEFFLANVDRKGARLLNFFKCVDAHEHKQVLDALLKQQTERGQSTCCSEEIIQMVLLLLAHFDEKEEHLFHFVEKMSLAEEVQMENVPPTPCLIVCGK
ncbi:uncharacterized protein LOC112486333 [Cynoglossus semilaevis]|uniref:uncharacterized protein LOC112486333 n=1 Tax=Cynoglossus semilaevis TaxID=244447 RepID=UPI000D62CABC|nr:uncharacterized protein LOC112486333 [Cynoglossus semilaevis]